MTVEQDSNAATTQSAASCVPLVSVVMSVHNGLPYLDEAIASVLGQTYPNLEFVFIDDGSTDGSRAALRHHARLDRRIRVIEQANTGLTRALIRGVAEARGTYIARMDADDASHPTRIERQIALLEEDAGVAAASCHLHYVLADGAVKRSELRTWDPDLLPWYQIFFNYVSGHSQMTFRKAAYEKAGGYDAGFRYSQDYDLWSRLADVGRIVVVEEVLHRFRVDHGSISSRRWHEQQAYSLEVSRRNYRNVTGRQIDEAASRLLREFWDRNGDVSFTPGDAPRVDALIAAAYHAFVGHDPTRSRHRRELRAIIGECWMHWGERTNLVRAPAVAGYMARALRWHPALAPAIGANLARRLAALATRGAKTVRRGLAERTG